MGVFKDFSCSSQFVFSGVVMASFVVSNAAIAQTSQQNEEDCKRSIIQRFVGSNSTTNQYGVRTTITSELRQLGKVRSFSPQQFQEAAVFGQFGMNWVYWFNLSLDVTDTSSRQQRTFPSYRVFCIVNPNQTQILGIESQKY